MGIHVQPHTDEQGRLIVDASLDGMTWQIPIIGEGHDVGAAIAVSLAAIAYHLGQLITMLEEDRDNG